jgi:phospholipid/cholesterol/gamma-HCH transport system substrate-binding protein
MAHRTRWRDLSIGLISAVGVIAAAALILTFGRVGSLHGKTLTIYVTTSAARGVIRGTEVWLDGQKVGLVRDINFRAPSVPRHERLVLALSVVAAAQPHLRLDSKIDIRPGATLIGDQVVFMSSGSAKMRAITDGDTIHSLDQSDMETVTSDFSAAARDFPPILENVKLLTAQLQSAEGTLGAFGIDMDTPEMTRLRTKTMRLMARLSDTSSMLATAIGAGNDLIKDRAIRAMARVDSIRALLASDQHALGHFRRDSSLVREVGELRTEMQRLQDLAASPNGTIGRIRSDSAITRGIHRDLTSLDSLFADLKKHPLRYIAF